MTVNQAENFCLDIHKTLTDEDYKNSVYVSIKGIGTSIIKNCAYQISDGWIFFWSKNNSKYIRESEIGDFVIIDAHAPSLKLEKT